jgi:hypothetical protein
MTKFTNIIETEKGGIKPTKVLPFEVATDRLSRAKECVARMERAADRSAYEKAWNEFVDYLEGSWTAFFHDGKSLSSKFQPWAGKYESQRKKDQMLRYLVQSRHKSQHARIELEWEKGKIRLGSEKEGVSLYRNFKIFSDGSNEIEFESGVPGNKPKVVFEPGKAMLPMVENTKHKQTFGPPTVHLGKKIGSKSPIDAANLAIAYYQMTYEKGKARFFENDE